MIAKKILTLFVAIFAASGFSSVVPPKVEREFRGAWVATVGNAVWPSRKGLSTAEQQTEMLSILDRAVKLKLNAIIFQVRPACDALYASQIEPWTEYLSGTMGKAPEPFYDPLAFTIKEAHNRGLELHAWFNPYRVRTTTDKSTAASNHISHSHPELVRLYGKLLWLDPGEKAVQDYTLSVMMDVVKRYDVDGIHMDDYFYPYREKNSAGAEIDFPDEASWKNFGAGGKLSREDWRRENVNQFIQRAYQSVKAAKPWVKFGISPFGIWRPGNPEHIQGLDSYSVLYGDSKKWLQNGWVDYLAPQLYWAIEPKKQSYPALLKWWTQQNTKSRHLWPGLNTGKAGREWKAEEITSQIAITRKQPGATGHIHWSMKSLMSSHGGLSEILEQETYAEPALIPASPWLGRKSPSKPNLAIENSKATWSSSGGEKVSLWVLQTQQDGKWSTHILPGDKFSFALPGNPSAVALTAVDRVGNTSFSSVFSPK